MRKLLLSAIMAIAMIAGVSAQKAGYDPGYHRDSHYSR